MAKVANAVLGGLLLLMLLTFVAWNVAPRALGLHPQVVLTGSMEPVLPVGSVTFIKSVNPEAVSSGDVVTYRSPKNNTVLITHRVVGTLDDGNGHATYFVTKGDANPVEDPPVPVGNVVGEVEYTIPHIGSLARRISSRVGFIVFVLGPAAYLFLSEVRSVVATVGEHRRPKAAA